MKDHRIFLECSCEERIGHLLLRTISKYVMATWYREGDGVERYYMLQAFAGALFTQISLGVITGCRIHRSRWQKFCGKYITLNENTEKIKSKGEEDGIYCCKAGAFGENA